MARPRSEERRTAILSAATRVFASQGLGASTAVIAKEAGGSNGSLFVYFDTKTRLINDLYVALKTEMATEATTGLPDAAEPREQLRHMWTRWLAWATDSPQKPRALAHIEVSQDITAESRQIVHAAFSDIAALLDRSRAGGAMQAQPLGFVLELVNAIADTTIAAILREPDQAATRSAAAFDAIWRVLAGPSPAATD